MHLVYVQGSKDVRNISQSRQNIADPPRYAEKSTDFHTDNVFQNIVYIYI